ncbi:MAG TPA: signal peptidase II [Pyrinomonadaceae bacterium]|nr:signal peptidase II [Pyrinomonadaceae bacterium]
MSINDQNLQATARTRLGWRAGYLLAGAGVYLMDQVTKAWAVKTLRFQPGRTIVQGFLDLVYTENPGIAFGQLQEGGAFGRWFFIVLAIIAALAVLYYFARTPRNDDRVLGACALLLAGIAGNLTDRLRLGYVIDFIVLHARSYHWPNFNIADASITIGALLLAFDLLFERQKTERQKAEVKDRRSEITGQKSEVRGQKSQVRLQTFDL